MRGSSIDLPSILLFRNSTKRSRLEKESETMNGVVLKFRPGDIVGASSGTFGQINLHFPQKAEVSIKNEVGVVKAPIVAVFPLVKDTTS